MRVIYIHRAFFIQYTRVRIDKKNLKLLPINSNNRYISADIPRTGVHKL